MTIYQRIQELAKQKRISIRELESTLHYSNGTLNKWKNSAPSDKLSEVAEFLGTTPNYLILGFIDKNEQRPQRRVELDDDDVIMTFDGKPIPDEDRELIKRLLRGK